MGAPKLDEMEGKTPQRDPRWKKRVTVLLVLILLTFLGFIYGLIEGPVKIPISHVWDALIHDTDSTERQIIWDIRLPRVLIGLLVGACLSIAGALLQGVMKNPLADPGVIGVSAGAGLVAVMMMILFPSFIHLLPIGAFIGAFAATVMIYLAAWERGISPVRMILAGVAINSLLGAMMSFIMLLYSDQVQAVLPWLVGGLSGRSWQHFQMIWPYALIGIVLSVFATKHANTLILGDDVAKLLGNKVERSRLFLILLSTFLAGAAVSVAGLITFVGLVVPHIIRMLIGNDYKYLLPISAIGGAFLVVLADTIARSWFDPLELPVGILLAMLGAPFFLYLLKGGMKGWKAS